MPTVRSPEAWQGAAEILAAVKQVDPAHRLDALAIACATWAKTHGTLKVPDA